MGTYVRKIAAGLLSLVLIVSLVLPARATQEKPQTYIRKILNYYLHYQQAAETDIRALLEQLAQVDPSEANTWEKIVKQWAWIDQQMQVEADILPDGLPEDDSLCIVIMGYCLNSDGSMQRELIRRLEVALRSAQKYPNAYVLCTGGATSGRGNITEAQAMAKWLEDRGVRKDRLIRENTAMSTTQNAIKSCKLLARSYPQVEKLAVITSDYHIYQSCILFAGMCGYTSDSLEVAGCAVYATGAGANASLSQQAQYLAGLAGVEIRNMREPALSQLTALTAEYDRGFTVTAHYDSGITRDVTEDAVIVWYDAHTANIQEVAITYIENGIPATCEVFMERTVPAVQMCAEEEIPEIPAPEPPYTPVWEVLAIAAVWLVLVAVMKALGWLK